MDEVTLQVDGSRLVGDLYEARKARGGVLLVHGLGSRAAEFGTFPAELAKAGFTAFAIDLRGYGRSGGERGLIDLGRASRDIDCALDELQRVVGKKPLALIGHSLGGALAVGYARRTSRLQCLVVAHPVDCMFDELNPAEKAVYHLMGAVGKRRMKRGRPAGMFPRPARYDKLYMDRQAGHAAAREDLVDGHVNIANYAFATTMRASDWAKNVRIAALAIHSPHDKIVKPDHTQDVVSALAGPVEHLAHDGGHSCWRDLDGDKISTGVVDFLRRHMEA